MQLFNSIKGKDQDEIAKIRSEQNYAAYFVIRPSLKIFLFPLARACFSGMGRSVGKYFFLTSQISYIVNCPNIGNKTKNTNNAELKIFKDNIAK